MRALTVSTLAVAALAVGIAVAPPQGAQAVHGGKSCGIVSKGSGDYRVRAQKMKCGAARRGALKYLRKRAALAGFECVPADGRTPFYCKDGTKVYWAIRL
jgi:hypothetical protein